MALLAVVRQVLAASRSRRRPPQRGMGAESRGGGGLSSARGRRSVDPTYNEQASASSELRLLGGQGQAIHWSKMHGPAHLPCPSLLPLPARPAAFSSNLMRLWVD